MEPSTFFDSVELSPSQDIFLKSRLLPDFRTPSVDVITICRLLTIGYGIARIHDQTEVAQNTIRDIRRAWQSGRLDFLLPYVIGRRLLPQALADFRSQNYSLFIGALTQYKQGLHWSGWYSADASVPTLHLADDGARSVLEIIRSHDPFLINIEERWHDNAKECQSQAQELATELRTRVENLTPEVLREYWVMGLALISSGLADHLTVERSQVGEDSFDLKFNTRALAMGVSAKEALRLEEAFAVLRSDVGTLAKPLLAAHRILLFNSKLITACLDEWLRL